MNSISIQKINTKHPDFEAVFALREKILRQPLGLSLYHEDTSADAEDDVYIALKEGAVIACLMVKPKGDGILKFRQMAVDSEYQAAGIGKQLMQAAEKDAQSNGFKLIELHARQYAVGFYEKLGYHAFGTVFEEVTLPHLAMKKFL